MKTNFHFFFFIVLTSFISLSFLADIESGDKALIKKISIYNTIYRHEKLYLHTDKPLYFTGENIWFSGFLTNARNNILNTTESVIYLELIKPNGNIASKQIFKIENGRVNGNLLVKGNYPSGEYLLVAYTNWMRNDGSDFYFKKKITIVGKTVSSNDSINTSSLPLQNENRDVKSINIKNQHQQISLKFYPEGGDIINGITAKVAFEALDQLGKPINIDGSLVDNQGNVIAVINSLWEGKGFFVFTPSTNNTYKAIINGSGNEKFEFDLENAKPSGFSLNIDYNYMTEKVQINVRNKSLNGAKRFFLLVMQEQKPIYALADSIDSTSKSYSVDKSVFSTGIAQFTIFDENKTPRCERLLFINNNDHLTLDINELNFNPSSRGKIELELDAKDKSGVPSSGTFSIAITDVDRIGDAYYHPIDFVKYVYFDSNIPGYNGDASVVFDNSRKGMIKTDLIMLTNGWRRYKWENVLQDKFEIPLYLEEPGIYVKGRLLRKSTLKQAPPGMDVTMFLKGHSDVYSQLTDDYGEFTFILNDFNDTISAVVQTKNRMNNQSDFAIDLESNLKSKPVDANARKRLSSKEEYAASTYAGLNSIDSVQAQKDLLTKELVRAKDTNFFLDTSDINIDEVTVMANQAKSVKEKMSNNFGAPAKSVGKKQLEDLTEEKSWNYGLISVISDAVPGLYIAIKENDSVPEQQAIQFMPTDRQLHRFFIYVDGKMVGATDDKGTLRSMLNLYSIDQLISLNSEIVESIDLIYPPKGKKAFDLDAEARRNEGLPAISINSNLTTGLSETELSETSEVQSVFSDLPPIHTSPEAILAIYTTNGGGLYSRTNFKGMLNIKLTGFAKTKEFYNPDYEKETEKITSDQRTTIYWNPNILTDSTGKVKFEFFNSDLAHQFRIDIVGLSKNGIPGNFRTTIGSNTPIPIPTLSIGGTSKIDNNYSTDEIDKGPEWHDPLKMKLTVNLSNSQPAAYADVSVIGKSWGTISDQFGTFYIDKSIVYDNDTIVISYQGKEFKSFLASEIKSDIHSISLTSNKITSSDLKGESLMIEALKVVYKTKSLKVEYSRGLYREQIFYGNEMQRLVDLSLIIRIPNYGNSTLTFATLPIEGRLFKTENYDNNAEFSPILNSLFKVQTMDAFSQELTFLNRSYKKYYNYTYSGTCIYQNRIMYIIDFDQSDDCSWALSKGFVLVDLATYGIAYINWHASPKGSKYIVPDSYIMGGTKFQDFKLTSESNESFYIYKDEKWQFKGGTQNVQFNMNSKTYTYQREYLTTEFLREEPKPFRPTTVEEMNTRFLLIKSPKYLIQFWREAWFLPVNDLILNNIPYMHEVIVLSKKDKK